jgi:NitT/TauT family transport system substrate-binding protein
MSKSDIVISKAFFRHTLLPVLLAITFVSLFAWLVWNHQNSTIGEQKEKVSTRIGIATWPGFAPVYLGVAREYFNGVSVKADIIDDFSARQAAFVSGKTDFTIYTVDSLAFDAGQGVNGKIVMVLDRSNGADGIVARKGIKSFADLKGLKVAYTRGSPAHFLLFAALSKAGMKISDITTIEVDDPTRAAEAFLAGSVDAAVTWEPYLSQIKTSGKGVVLGDTRTINDRIIDVLVASNEVVKNNPKLVQDVVSGWMRALDEIARPKTDTYSIMAKGLGMPEADFREGAIGVTFADRDMNWYWLGQNESGRSKSQDLFSEASNLWVSAGFKKAPGDESDYSTETFVKGERR